VKKAKFTSGAIFIISGPSGSGKTTLAQRVLKGRKLKGKLAKSVSLTTRPKRTGEADGRDYFFISKQEFLRRQRAKNILEWTRYLGYYYATPKAFAKEQLAKGRSLVLCLDFNGVRQVRRHYPDKTVAIFVAPPSLEELRHRIEGRCSETTKEEIARRMVLAEKELSGSARYDYYLVNKDLKDAVRELEGIILKHMQGQPERGAKCLI